jgi:hypothetical protein
MGMTYQGILRSEENKFSKLKSFFRKSIMQRLEHDTSTHCGIARTGRNLLDWRIEGSYISSGVKESRHGFRDKGRDTELLVATSKAGKAVELYKRILFGLEVSAKQFNAKHPVAK